MVSFLMESGSVVDRIQLEENMKITEISVNLYKDERLKGFVNIILDDLFVIRGLKVIRG